MSKSLVEFKVESSEAMNALARYQVATRKSWGDVLKQSLRRVALNLVYQTQPFGDSQEVKKRSESKIKGDIQKIYAPIGIIYAEIRKIDKPAADAFYYFCQVGQWKKAERILTSMPVPNRNTPIAAFDKGASHKARFQHGRITGGRSKSQIVKNKGALDTYIKRKQRLVGFAKSGWVEVARKLGGVRGIPGWVKKQKGPGSIKDRTAGQNDPVVFGTNEVSYVSQVLKPRQIQEAYAREDRIAVTQAKHAERAAARKAKLA